jgi:hypothetical protein
MMAASCRLERIAETLLQNSYCCNQAWVLKNSLSLQNDQIWGIENVSENRERRLYGILTRFYFCEFLGREFFNNHRHFHQLSAGRHIVGEIAIFRQLTDRIRGIPLRSWPIYDPIEGHPSQSGDIPSVLFPRFLPQLLVKFPQLPSVKMPG